MTIETDFSTRYSLFFARSRYFLPVIRYLSTRYSLVFLLITFYSLLFICHLLYFSVL